MLNNIDVNLSTVLALDISWSRLSKGVEFHQQNRVTDVLVKPFVADIKEIPLHGGCVDVTTSYHALEPNGKSIDALLSELFRVTKRKLVLFEPSYEMNSKEGRARMDELGYIKDIEGEVARLGGTLDLIPIKNVPRPLNPTFCYVIEPPEKKHKALDSPVFCVPGTDFKLENHGNFFVLKRCWRRISNIR